MQTTLLFKDIQDEMHDPLRLLIRIELIIVMRSAHLPHGGTV